MPAHAKVSEDHSKYFFKTPQEMSRHEIANLEQMLREIDERLEPAFAGFRGSSKHRLQRHGDVVRGF